MSIRRCHGKQIMSILNIVLIISCLVHIGFIGYNILYPELPTIHVYDKDLRNIRFPISFRVCAEEAKPSRNYEKYGYNNQMEYFRGRSRYNKTLIGWAGHTENGSNIGTVEGR